MRFAYFPGSVAKNGHTVLESFLASCQDQGITTVANDMTADAAIIWSQLWRGRMAANQQVWRHYKCLGKPVIVLEVGALIRGVTWRVSWNDQQWLARGRDSSRAHKLGLTLHTWRNTGSHIIIALQHHHSEQWHGMPPTQQWCQDVIHQLRQHTDREIFVRPHPRSPVDLSDLPVSVTKPKPLSGTYDDYDFIHVLDTSWAVINHNSNTGIQAAIHGVPVFVDRSSRAAEVGNLNLRDIENPRRPGRQQWFNDLAWTEYTVEEIRQGIPLKLMLDQWLA
jgi:hypothetical protein